MGQHIRQGRDELNFSHWDRMGSGQRAEAIEETLQIIAEAGMPPAGYALLHPEARLTRQDLAQPRQDAGAAGYSDEHGSEDRDDNN